MTGSILLVMQSISEVLDYDKYTWPNIISRRQYYDVFITNFLNSLQENL
jgi:hypothetical protein